jgi:hypothetical protein
MPSVTPRSRPWSRAGWWPWWLHWYRAQGLEQQDARIERLYLDLLGSGNLRPGQQVADAVGVHRSTVHRALVRQRQRHDGGWPPLISNGFGQSAAAKRRQRLWQERGLVEQYDGSMVKLSRVELDYQAPDGPQEPGMDDRADQRYDPRQPHANDHDQDQRPSVTPPDAQDPGASREVRRSPGGGRVPVVSAGRDRVRYVENDRVDDQVGELSEAEAVAQIRRRKLDRALARIPEPNRGRLLERLRSQYGRDPTVTELKRHWLAYRRMISDADLDWSPV